jgi:tight adherence protein C
MKGNRELVDFLKLSATDSWEEKKQLVKQKGEKASTKLMIPIGMILIGIMIMILVPILSNLGI